MFTVKRIRADGTVAETTVYLPRVSTALLKLALKAAKSEDRSPEFFQGILYVLERAIKDPENQGVLKVARDYIDEAR